MIFIRRVVITQGVTLRGRGVIGVVITQGVTLRGVILPALRDDHARRGLTGIA